MEVKLGHTRPIGLFILVSLASSEDLPSASWRCSVRCHGIVSHMAPLFCILRLLVWNPRVRRDRRPFLRVMTWILRRKHPYQLPPYSMTSSASADGSWSAIMTYSLFIIIYCYFLEKSVSLMAFEQLSLNVRTRGKGCLASFLNKSVASFPALLYLINSSPPPLIFPYCTFVNHKRERAVIPSPTSLSPYCS